MKLTPAQQNTIRAQARKCIAECGAATVGLDGNRDAVTRPITRRHYDEIAPICKPFSRFLVTIGQITGILEER